MGQWAGNTRIGRGGLQFCCSWQGEGEQRCGWVIGVKTIAVGGQGIKGNQRLGGDVGLVQSRVGTNRWEGRMSEGRDRIQGWEGALGWE